MPAKSCSAHTSSVTWGANGFSSNVNTFSSSLVMLPFPLISFIRAIRAAMAVLNFKFSTSSPTFFMVLWKTLSISGRIPAPSINRFCRFQYRSTKRRHPFTLVVLHGAAFSKSPMNISYSRSVSAPNSRTTSSGFTTFPRLLLIFSPFSPRIIPWLVRLA